MKDINAIIFDFGGVLYDIDFKRTNEAFYNLGVKHFKEMYSQKDASPLFQHLEEGKINEAEFYEAFRKATDLNLADEQIKNAWNALLLSFRKEALNTLKALSPKYKLYLLSNTNIIHYNYFTKVYKDEIGEGSLDDYFDKAYYSQQIKLRKPDKEAYKLVIKENNLVPSKTLFIDDSIQNIEAAKAAGLQAIHLKPGMTIGDLGL